MSEIAEITISLSGKSVQAINELRSLTDAEDTSAVFRNALRLHLVLVRGHNAGARLFMKRDGGDQYEPVNIFEPVDEIATTS